LTETERVKYKAILEIYDCSWIISRRMINLIEASARLELKEIIDVEDAFSVLPEMEILARSSWELARGLEKLLDKIEFAIRIHPPVKEWFDLRVREWNLGIANMDEYVNMLEDLIIRLDEIATQLETTILDTIDFFGIEYIPVKERNIPKIVEMPPVPPEIVPPDLAAFFDEFDIDRDGAIDLGEAEGFFYWVEANIVYRYDDEFEQTPIPGAPVGDGRAGPDYWQTPYETWAERAGDCEDMAILHVAFYNYFGISAYVATVSTKPNGVLDHAIAIVLIASAPEEFADLLGGIVYYDLDGQYYMLVDSAYSDVFGYLHHGLERGAFIMKPYIEGKSIFTLEEAVAMHAKLRP